MRIIAEGPAAAHSGLSAAGELAGTRRQAAPPTLPNVPGMKVALLVTCLAEAFAPQVADAAARLVAAAAPDAEVVPVDRCCCGQPAWNAGYPGQARTMARGLLPRLRECDLVVVPSGSCATMLLRYYPHLFAEGDPAGEAARAVAAKTVELTAFLAAHLPADGAPPEGAAAPTGAGGAPSIAFHPSCHSLRGARVGDAGERCLRAAGCEVRQAGAADECCGFGGLFAVKEDALSVAMADRKLDGLLATGAPEVAAGELGCLMHLEGRAQRRGMSLRFRHVAEVLADANGRPAGPGGPAEPGRDAR